MRRGTILGTVLVFTGLLSLACGGPPPEGGQVERGSPAAPKAEEKPAQVGDTITFDADSEWVVEEAKDLGQKARSNNQFQEDLKTEGRFVQVKFSVKNLGPKEIRVFSNPEAQDSQGRRFKSIDMITFYIPKDAKSMSLEGVGPGLKKTYYTVYELPPDAADIQMEVWEAHKAFGGDKKLVTLGI